MMAWIRSADCAEHDARFVRVVQVFASAALGARAAAAPRWQHWRRLTSSASAQPRAASTDANRIPLVF